jgi:predicted secreted protein
MATLSGKSGKIEYGGGKVASIRNWSLNMDTNMLDHTSWSTGTDQWRSFTAGLSGWSGSAGDLWDETSTGQDTMRTNFLTPSTATIVFHMDKSSGGSFSGACYVSGISMGAAIDGDVTANYTLQGTGALSYSTST